MRLHRMVLVLTCLSATLPLAINAAERAAGSKAKTQVTDISLRANGILIGQVVNSQGASVAAAKVTVYHGRTVIAETKSDRTGGFVVRKLRGGVHQVAAGQGVSVVRLWTTQAAPPSSRSTLTIVSDKQVVRGQCGDAGCTGGCGQGCGDDDVAAGFFGIGGSGLAGTAGLIATTAVVGGILAATLDDDDPASP